MKFADQNREIDHTEPVTTILVAEDDQDLLTAIKLRCMAMGHEVIAVDDALTALSCADLALPNLIILDVEMPGGNGLAACEMLATDENFAQIPVIIHTGRSDDETRQRCEALGATYVQKSPDSCKQLESLIQEKLAVPQCSKSSQTRMLSSY